MNIKVRHNILVIKISVNDDIPYFNYNVINSKSKPVFRLDYKNCFEYKVIDHFDCSEKSNVEFEDIVSYKKPVLLMSTIYRHLIIVFKDVDELNRFIMEQL